MGTLPWGVHLQDDPAVHPQGFQGPAPPELDKGWAERLPPDLETAEGG